jgi:hypothetical protein
MDSLNEDEAILLRSEPEDLLQLVCVPQARLVLFGIAGCEMQGDSELLVAVSSDLKP